MSLPRFLMIGLFGALALARPMAATAADVTHLVVGDNGPTAPSWPLLIAREQGYLGADGLDVEFVYAGGTTQVVQQLIGGSVDVGSTSFESVVLAVDKVAAAADPGRVAPGWEGDGLPGRRSGGGGGSGAGQVDCQGAQPSRGTDR